MRKALLGSACAALVASVAACGGNSAPQNMGSNNWNASHERSTSNGAYAASYGGGAVIAAAPPPTTAVVAPSVVPGTVVVAPAATADTVSITAQNSLAGRAVANTAGQTIGTVESVAVSNQTGQIRYVVASGPFLGANRYMFIPAQNASLMPDGRVMVNAPQATVVQAPIVQTGEVRVVPAY
jgi:hypothetical protein